MRSRYPTWDEILSPEDRVLLDDGPNTGVDGRYGPEIRDLDGEKSAFPSEFDHILEQFEEAQYSPDGQPLGELDQAFQRQELERAEDRERAPYVSINPPSWDAGNLGGVVSVSPSSTAISRVAFWPGSSAREVLPCTLTVQSSRRPTAGRADSVGSSFFARINWGVHGASFTADVDIGFGIQLVLNASSVGIGIGIDDPQVGTTTTQTAIDVFGSIGFYAAPVQTPAYRTILISSPTFSFGSTVRVNRPAFATTVATVERANAAVPFTMNFLNLGGGTIMQRVVAASAYLTPIPIPLTSDTVAFNIVNNSADTSTNCRVVWGMF